MHNIPCPMVFGDLRATRRRAAASRRGIKHDKQRKMDMWTITYPTQPGQIVGNEVIHLLADQF